MMPGTVDETRCHAKGWIILLGIACPSAVPAKAGTHRPDNRAVAGWVPAFAGTAGQFGRYGCFGEWEYVADRNATARAYALAERGGADACGCAGCRNFRLARARIFPARFLELLDELGIDPRKDGEVYHLGRLGPGVHAYGGWYHFVGMLVETGDCPPLHLGSGFQVWMCRASAPRLESLESLPVVQVEFYSKSVPWLLDEPEEP
jgi:hypothetical protein